MEKVTAYKAFNGRLFETEEKCLAYEKKMSQYPKVKVVTSKSRMAMPRPNYYIDVNIIKQETITWDSPSKRKSDVRYIVNDKYYFTGSCPDAFMMSGIDCTIPAKECEYLNPKDLCRVLVHLAFSEEGITDKTINETVEKYHSLDKYSQMKADIITSDKKWIMVDERWKSGGLPLYNVIVEKIK